MPVGGFFYHITELGLMPITTMEIFTNNGGKTQLVVPMNQADTQLPRISVMEMSDWRLN
jgi:hypothetical protein